MLQYVCTNCFIYSSQVFDVEEFPHWFREKLCFQLLSLSRVQIIQVAFPNYLLYSLHFSCFYEMLPLQKQRIYIWSSHLLLHLCFYRCYLSMRRSRITGSDCSLSPESIGDEQDLSSYLQHIDNQMRKKATKKEEQFPKMFIQNCK